jgi:spore coat protein A
MRPRRRTLRFGGPARPLRVRVLVGLSSASLVGAGSLVLGPLTSPVLAAVPCGQAPTSPVPTFFTDEVGQPPVAAPDAPNHYTLTAHKGAHSFNSAWPAVPTLGYSTANATMDYLGPTIVTKKGTPVDVKIVNGLPAGTAMFPQFGYPTNNNNVVMHRHGGLQPALSDGAPDQIVAPGGSRTNHYPNNQAAAPLWYHDHADAVTSFNVYAGLAGFMPNTDVLEPLYNMPTGNFAKAYVLQDKSFDPATKALCYTHLSPEFFGDLPVINGTIAPKQTLEPRRYTFTFINGSDSRFYNLTLKPADGTTGVAPQMTVVGSDSGYLLKPAKVNAQLISPGERYKVIVDFTGRTGQWVLSNNAATPYPAGDPTVATMDQLMRFDVGSTLSGPDRSSVPTTILETNNLVPPALSLLTARLRTVQAGEKSPGVPQLGDKTALKTFTDAATETPQLGSTEAWAMRNHSPDSHPIHEHLVELRLVGRWPVTAWGYKDALGVTQPGQDPLTGNAFPVTVGAFQPPGAFESGPKDTFVAPVDTITVWVGQYTIGGKSVWHCHILSHEDSSIVEMMRPLVVGSAAQTQLPRVLTQARLDQLIRQP